eukprot:TRINITY_DN18595_c0_g1_i1.p1 TRINITY_DN18595_c0_g1~~TRINITY_DN18595_c0_g1_i1.p1  ORF type:complete len:178 (-),score=19.56 TRINITY_DN18595_c0_g1_i1:158-691(-)
MCRYCKSAVAQSLANYSTVCSPEYYPAGVYMHPVPEASNCTEDVYMERNPCCPRFKAGDRVLYLNAYELSGPWADIPVRCSETGSKCSRPNEYNGQVCNSRGFCGFTTGRVLGAASSAAPTAKYTACTYKVGDFLPRSTIISDVIASEQYLMSAVDASYLVADAEDSQDEFKQLTMV